MSQTCSVAFSKISTIFIIFLLSICLASPLNSFFKKINTKSYQKDPQNNSNNRLNFLEKTRHHSKYSADESNSDRQYETSCGKITCDDVEDYPIDMIERAFSKKYRIMLPSSSTKILNQYEKTKLTIDDENKFKSTEEVMETDIFNSFLKIKKVKADYPSQENSILAEDNSENEDDDKDTDFDRLSPDSMRESMNSLIRSIHHTFLPEERTFHRKHIQPYNNNVLNTTKETCDPEVKITSPREAVNNQYKPVTLVQIDSYSIEVIICKAKMYCQDPSTPDDHMHRCEQKIESRTVLTFNPTDKTLMDQIVLVPRGCDCKLIRIKDIADYASK